MVLRGRSHSAHCVGFSVAALIALMKAVAAITRAKLGEHLAGETRDEGCRNEHRHQHQRDADHRPHQLVHRLDRRVVTGHAFVDVARHAFHDHDGVVDHDADRQHDAEQGREVDGEAERGHGRERADDGDGDRRGRHQHRPASPAGRSRSRSAPARQPRSGS